MKSKTIILWGNEDVLERAVELFLSSRQDWEVIQIPGDVCDDDLIAEVTKANPDVAILCFNNGDRETAIHTRLMEGCPGVKIITISLETNQVDVYQKVKVRVDEVSDLISAVES